MVAEKASSGLFVGLLAYIVGQVNTVVVAMMALILIDFITGIMSAYKNGVVFSNKVAADGFIKKSGMLILWLLAVIVQLVIEEQGASVGLNMTQPLIVLGITFYLIGSECVSILQNLREIDVLAPNWFKKSVKAVQDVMENKEVE